MLTEAAETKLREAALLRNDQELLIAIGSVSSLIAREVHYHKLCYGDYTRKTTLDRIARRNVETGQAEHEEQSPFDRAFASLTIEIDKILFEKQLPVTITYLVTFLSRELQRLGGACAEVRADTVKEKLINHFHQQLTFARPDSRNEPAIVYATEHTERIIANLFHGKRGDTPTFYGKSLDESDPETSEEDGDDLRSSTHARSHELVVTTDEVRIVYHAARILRNKALEHAATVPSASTGTSLTPERGAECIPDLLFNFLAWFVSSDHHADIPDRRLKIGDPALCQCISSLGQDIMFAATGVVPTKHIVLGMALHHVYRSKLLITLLNRFGHTIAYSQVLERETKLAKKMLHNGDGLSTLPPVINRSKPFYYVADNNDLNEETLDGKGTMHCTNTIIVQPILSALVLVALVMLSVQTLAKNLVSCPPQMKMMTQMLVASKPD